MSEELNPSELKSRELNPRNTSKFFNDEALYDIDGVNDIGGAQIPSSKEVSGKHWDRIDRKCTGPSYQPPADKQPGAKLAGQGRRGNASVRAQKQSWLDGNNNSPDVDEE